MPTPSASDSAALDFGAYRAGIQRAIERGLIKYGDPAERPAHDLFAHYADGVGWAWKPTNTRPLCPSAAAILRQLRDRPRLRILELGPGAGVAAAEVRAIVEDCSLTTIGLTPIVPAHSFETPICAYAAIGTGLICSARTWAGVW